MTYLRWWLATLRCSHPWECLRGVYGDEILFGSGGKRVMCGRCGKYLDLPLSEVRNR